MRNEIPSFVPEDNINELDPARLQLQMCEVFTNAGFRENVDVNFFIGGRRTARLACAAAIGTLLLATSCRGEGMQKSVQAAEAEITKEPEAAQTVDFELTPGEEISVIPPITLPPEPKLDQDLSGSSVSTPETEEIQVKKTESGEQGTNDQEEDDQEEADIYTQLCFALWGGFFCSDKKLSGDCFDERPLSPFFGQDVPVCENSEDPECCDPDHPYGYQLRMFSPACGGCLGDSPTPDPGLEPPFEYPVERYPDLPNQ